MLHLRLLLAGTVVAGLVAPTGAHAAPPTAPVTAELDEEEVVPRPVLGVAAGAATSLLSLGTGAMLIARSHEREVRNAGLLGIHGGLGLSPLVAHAISGELGRGALFSLVPIAMGAGTATLMGFYPGFLTRAPAAVQWTTYSMLAISIASSAIGVLDAATFGDRARARAGARGLRISAMVDGTTAFATIGGGI
jgi:hypothetical protein